MAETNPMQAAWDAGMQYMRDVAAATEGMSDKERNEWCAQMDAWRDALAEQE